MEKWTQHAYFPLHYYVYQIFSRLLFLEIYAYVEIIKSLINVTFTEI